MNNVEYPGVQLTWKRILAIAQDQPDPMTAKDTFQDQETEQEEQQEQAAFRRIQCMSKALQNIYTITSQDHGYVAFMVTMATELKFGCPISMAFLKHVIDFSEIPTRHTLENVTSALLNKATTQKTKTNTAIIWAMLAQKFAGSLAESIWTDELGDMLIQSLHDDNNIYSLLALDSFALTGALKQHLMKRFAIAHVIQQSLDKIGESMCLMLQQSPLSSSFESITTNSPSLTLVSIKHHVRIYKELKSAVKSCKSKLAKKRKSFKVTQSWNYKALCNEMEKITVQAHKDDNSMSILNMRKLHFCLSWSLNNVFAKPTAMTWTSMPRQPKTCMQPIDANSHCKFSKDCLQVRNDTFFFESVRATAGIASSAGGKWYYEVHLLTDGIMQIGWATPKCLLSSQEGSGVGDDRNGFAFDTYRCAVWAAGELHLSRAVGVQGKCKTGDVLGCLLDLDQNYCAFFINGQDYGFRIALATQSAAPYYPTISLTGHQHVAVNFGDQPWDHALPGVQAVDDVLPAVAGPAEKQQQLDTVAEDEEGPLCNICYSESVNTKLFPCEHGGFGKNCAQAFQSW
ncbi:concanavalin A-like lectin/glucanase domain-containing protein [Parasitella parasitica]|nr:concanavalin A-like lectin/glucanase domain-containing protein [Parasitella parasitica]